MRLPTDLGTWGFILAILGIVLMYPVGLLINLTTPLVQMWIATRSTASLRNRIQRLEGELAELEKTPPISEVEDQLLWNGRATKIAILGATSTLTLLLYFGIQVVGDVNSRQFKVFSVLVFSILVLNLIGQMVVRYGHDLRYARSPRRRKNLRIAIDDLRKIRDSA